MFKRKRKVTTSLKLDYFKQNDMNLFHHMVLFRFSSRMRRWMVRNARYVRSHAYERYLQPAITYARYGFPVTEVIAFCLKQGTDILKQYPNIKEVYMPSGKAPTKVRYSEIRS